MPARLGSANRGPLRGGLPGSDLPCFSWRLVLRATRLDLERRSGLRPAGLRPLQASAEFARYEEDLQWTWPSLQENRFFAAQESFRPPASGSPPAAVCGRC